MAAAHTKESCICISFALPQEFAPFRRQVRRRASAGTDTVRAGYSGTGTRLAARHATELLSAAGPAPAALLICGFAGALSDADIGDVVIADRVFDCTSPANNNMTDAKTDRIKMERDKTEYRADSRLLATAESVHLPGVACRVGALATSPRVLIDRDEKRAFLNRHGLRAACVDMETAGAARVAEERGIPWLAVRTVTDRYEDSMPFDFNALADGEGNVQIGRIMVATLAHPGKIPELIRFGKQSSRAANNLAGFLSALLPLIKISPGSLCFVLLAMRLLTSGAVAIAQPAATPSSQGSDRPLTVEASVALALARNPQVRIAQSIREVARIGADRERPVSRPTVNATASGTVQGPRVLFPRPDDTEATFLPEQAGRLDLVLEQPLYRAGLGAARMRYAAQAALPDLDYARTLADLTLAVRKAYLNVLEAEAGIRMATDGLTAAQRYQALVERQIAAGVAKPVDSETVRSQVAEAEAGLQKAEGSLKLAQDNFNYTLGRQRGTSVTLQPITDLPAVPDSPDAAIALALQTRPELVELEQNLRAAQAGISLARVQNQPSVLARGQLTEQTPTALVHEHYAAATIEIRWSLLDGGKARQDTREAQAQVQRLLAEQDHTRQSIAFDVSQAWQRMQDAYNQIVAARVQQQGLEHTATVAEKAYEFGQGTALEVQAAQREVRNARARELNATYDLHSAAADFQHAQGTDMPAGSGKKDDGRGSGR
jgi:outer membrane protein TolC/nucleoside phosphorylase